MTVDIDLWVTATILRELRNSGLITQKEAEKILSRVAKQTGATLIISVRKCSYFSSFVKGVVVLCVAAEGGEPAHGTEKHRESHNDSGNRAAAGYTAESRSLRSSQFII